MKRSIACVFSLLLCVCMLLGAAPTVKAQTLESKRYSQMKAIVTDESGETYFTTAEDLATLAQQAAGNPNQIFSCNYNGENALTVSGDLTVPNNMYIYTYTAPNNQVVVPDGVTLTVNGFFGAGRMDVQGVVSVAEGATLAISQGVNIANKLKLDGSMRMLTGLGTQLSGAERIQYGKNSFVWFNCTYNTEAQLREIFTMAETSPANWYYDCYNRVATLTLAAPLTVPANCFLCADQCEAGQTVTFSGAAITVLGEMDFYTTTVVNNDLIVPVDGNLYAASMFPEPALTLNGNLLHHGYMDVYSPVVFRNKVENYGALDVWFDDGGCLTFEKPELYRDDNGEAMGVIWVDSVAGQFPAGALVGMTKEDFGKVTYETAQTEVMPFWGLWNYKNTGVSKPEQTEVSIPMYRLYNPNSGEHFYTGSTQERDMLVGVGWQYEGIAWNAPTKSGAPVYRLFNPNNGDHHYTMSAEERDMLVTVGWQYEGIAWNSASPSNLPMYRLFNPNADCGSHHYTGSTEERDFLVSLGWIYEGIGWYGLAK